MLAPMSSPTDPLALDPRLLTLERAVWRLRLTVFAMAAVLLALVTCGSDGYSTSGTREQLGLLMAREIRVGDEQAAVHIVGSEIQMRRQDGGRVTIEANRIRFLATDGAEMAAFTVEGGPQLVARPPGGGAKTWP